MLRLRVAERCLARRLHRHPEFEEVLLHDVVLACDDLVDILTILALAIGSVPAGRRS